MRRRQLFILPAFGVAVACLAAVLMGQNGGSADHGSTAAGGHVVLKPDHLKWASAPPGLPPGATMAVLEGNPGEEGAFTLRAKFPAGYQIPAHWHSRAEHITVLSGTFCVGAGDKLDKDTAARLPAGGYASMPPKMHHFAFCDEDAVVQVHGMGPFDITYINPSDDPRKQAEGAKP